MAHTKRGTTAKLLLDIQYKNYEDDPGTLKNCSRTFLGAKQQGFRYEVKDKDQPRIVEHYVLARPNGHFLHVYGYLAISGNDYEELFLEVLNSLESTLP